MHKLKIKDKINKKKEIRKKIKKKNNELYMKIKSLYELLKI
jgi:hypothetical protein